MTKKQKYILWYRELSVKDVPLVGGKNASLGEMFSQLTKKGVNIPDGFALTSKAYWYYLKKNKIDRGLKRIFKKFNPKSLESLRKTGKAARQLILQAEIPEDLKKGILRNYKKLSQKYNQENIDVAVRSSATAEDLPSASFAGQHETYLNVVGSEELLKAVKNSIASLFTDRAIAYREEKGFKHLKIALSVGVQKMVGSGGASAGVMFTLDTETGFSNVVLINSIFGIGEMIVKGLVTPDQFYIFKPTLRQAQGKLYRPIISKKLGRKNRKYIYGQGGGLKEVKVSLKDQSRFSLTDEEILTLAKWAQIIEKHYSKRAGKWMPQDIEWAKDGRTKQLFIVQSRPETVHAIKSKATFEEYKIKSEKKPVLTGIAIGDKIGQGKVRVISDISKLTQFKKGEVLVTRMTDPDWVSVFPLVSAIVTDEGGKTEKIRIHPLALCDFNKIKDGKVKREIERLTICYKDKKQYFVDKLAEGVAQIAAAFWPKSVIVRLSDFKTKEYRGLIGGEPFEEEEANPMLGFRGASRYLDKGFQPAFRMECQAIKKVREEFGLRNIVLMVPFCRTVEEGKKVISLMKKFGLEKGKDGLKVIVMCEIPSNVILAEEFLKVFDGMSIGSNDLTQLLMGMDRDNARIAYIADERNEAVKRMISKVIRLCRQKKKYSGICGQGPSDIPEFAEFLMKEGIESISINPDTVIKTILNLAKIKRK